MPVGVYVHKPNQGFQKGHKICSGMKFPGRHQTEETKRKISEALKGKQNTLGIKHSPEANLRKSILIKREYSLGLRKSAMLGRKRPIEERIKISQSMRGEKGPGWKGGVSSINNTIRGTIEFRLWREAVFARDGWTCQKCKQIGGKLHAHHIKPFAKYPELRFSIDNGITLCKNCHSVEHRRYQDAFLD